MPPLHGNHVEFWYEPLFSGVGETLIFLSDRVARHGGQYAALCSAKADSRPAGSFAPAVKNDAVAVFQKSSVFLATDLSRPAAARAESQQRPRLSGGGPRLSAGSEQIA